MTQPFAVTLRQLLVAPLGLRFWDAVLSLPVDDGLSVTASPLASPTLVKQATVSPSGVYGFRHLPGLGDAEHGAGDDAYWASVAQRRFTVSVADTQRRFQPFHFAVMAPTRGIVTSVCEDVTSPPDSPPSSPPDVSPGISLYSTATRQTPAGMAVLRADLWDTVAQAPAAWALVAARPPGQPPAWGMADANGRVAVFFPYPEPVSPGPALWQQTWQVALRAAYAPDFPIPAAPDLCAALGQSAATLWSDWAQTSPLTGISLAFGEDLVVRTLNTTAQPQPSVLLITPAASPP